MSGIKAVPAPWKLKGTTWIFVLSGLLSNNNFPPGWVTPYQTEALSQGGQFVGGPALVQLVSYSESPVGPYDELIYIPGRWEYEHNDPAFRITRIYVSSKESAENGRRNWNIPKQVANFSYTSGPDDTFRFTVSNPTTSNTTTTPTPFFSASAKPLLGIPLLSSLPIPFSTSLLGNYFSLMQPPLPPNPNISAHPEEIGTDKWAALTPVLKGGATAISVIPGFEDGSVGDGVGFPKVKPLGVGGMIEGLELDFGVSEFFDSV